MAKGKRLENKHQNENLEEERLRFDDQAGRGIGKLGLLQRLKEVEFTLTEINLRRNHIGAAKKESQQMPLISSGVNSSSLRPRSKELSIIHIILLLYLVPEYYLN